MICFFHIANSVRHEAFMIDRSIDVITTFLQQRSLGAKFQETLS